MTIIIENTNQNQATFSAKPPLPRTATINHKTDTLKSSLEHDSNANRDPMVNVIKAFSFGENRRTKNRLLNINLPPTRITSRQSSETCSEKSKSERSESSVQSKTQFTRRPRKQLFLPVLSPTLSYKEAASPQTEVAKWTPDSINKHTKPYYDAWIQSTVSAMVKR